MTCRIAFWINDLHKHISAGPEDWSFESSYEKPTGKSILIRAASSGDLLYVVSTVPTSAAQLLTAEANATLVHRPIFRLLYTLSLGATSWCNGY